MDVARYKNDKYLTQSDHEIYDTEHKPGAVIANSGIYGCADEIAANKGNPLPP